jgi:heterodisulfide reductase subunit A-like polyferredoxin
LEIPVDTINNELPKKIGVFICACGKNIGAHVDVEKVAEKMKEIPGVGSRTKTNPRSCKIKKP